MGEVNYRQTTVAKRHTGGIVETFSIRSTMALYGNHSPYCGFRRFIRI
jgi:hypothetical protein